MCGDFSFRSEDKENPSNSQNLLRTPRIDDLTAIHTLVIWAVITPYQHYAFQRGGGVANHLH